MWLWLWLDHVIYFNFDPVNRKKNNLKAFERSLDLGIYHVKKKMGSVVFEKFTPTAIKILTFSILILQINLYQH